MPRRRTIWIAGVALIAAAAVGAVAVAALDTSSVSTTEVGVSDAGLAGVQPIAAVAGVQPATAPTIVSIASAPDGEGYLIVDSAGTVYAYGTVADHGDLVGVALAQPIVGSAVTPTSGGYWLVASDGGVFAFGDARFHGSTGAITLDQPVVAMASTPSGNGYWLVASDGGVFAFGDARFHGSTGGLSLRQPVVGIEPTAAGDGYVLVASDGGVFAFGRAGFFGSTGGLDLAQPIIAIAATPSGNGYRMLARDGGEFDYGDATFIGSVAERGVRFVAGAVRPQGDGHWMVTSAGQLQQVGLAPRLGAPVAGPPAAPPPPLADANVALELLGRFDEPMALRSRPGDTDRLYVAERAGRIVGFNPATQDRQTIIDITSLTTTDSERGLLGFDFSPDGSKVYLNHTDRQGNVELAEYDLASTPPTRRLLLEIAQPFSNHNGGDVHVTSDGVVWASSGDGGSGGDPQGNAQDRSNLLGTIYRIDPTPSGAAAYTIPADNPFVGQASVRPEIWAYGLRNPWRFDIDEVGGVIWIGDVGQNSTEEINRQPLNQPGANFGWKRFEGDQFFADVPAPGAIGPVHTYGRDSGCSITGGAVYQGPITALADTYLFSDFCTGVVWGIRHDGSAVAEVEDLGVRVPQIVQFGTGPDGALYLVSLGGDIFRLTSN
jgi:glucose/arabinose dehydrogenase